MMNGSRANPEDLLLNRIIEAESNGRIESFITAIENGGLMLNSANESINGFTSMPIAVNPYVLSWHDLSKIKREMKLLIEVLELVIRLILNNDKLLSKITLTKEELELVLVNSGLNRSIWISRNDGFFVSNQFKFIEFNTDSPSCPFWTDILLDEIDRNFIEPYKNDYDYYHTKPISILLNTLTEAYSAWGGKGKPNIAVVAEKRRFYPEFLQAVNSLRSAGFNASFSTPEEVDYMNGKAYTPDGMEIDLLYRRGALEHWTERCDDTRLLRQAYTEGAFCCINPIRSILAADKIVLEILSDEKTLAMLPALQAQIVRKSIPWTRSLTASFSTCPDGKKIDLLEYVRNHRNNLVLKPARLHGGQGVCIGKDTSEQVWEKKLALILLSEDAYVAQEYVPVHRAKMAILLNGKINIKKQSIDQSFFLFNGQYGGGMIRTSDNDVVNLAAGGALGAIFGVNEI